MFPGLGGLDPKKMQAMMSQMGISQEDIDASKVTIEKSNGEKIVFENPTVAKINMQGQDSWQITGEAKTESAELFTEQDVQTIVEKTQCTEDKAREVLEKTQGDLAEAILELS